MPEFQIPPPLNSKDLTNLVCDMFNEIYSTTSFKCFGKNGHKQKGIDILSVEKDIVIQSKLKDLTRKKILLKRELLSDIDETIDFIVKEKPKIKFKTLYIVTTLSEHPDFDEYCETLREEKHLEFNIVFWGWETIQRELITLPKTIASHYSNFIIGQHSNETKVLSNLEMKRKIEIDFADWINYSFENRKRRSRMIIHSIEDTAYPEHVLNKENQYQWFGSEIKGRTHKGLEFITGLIQIYVDKENFWTDLIPENHQEFSIVPVMRVSVIAYEDIVGYDIRGDEHYICPHFFCKFRHKGTPFIEEYYWQKDKIQFPYVFEESTRKHYS
jgi:hypothetical protein